jgi:dihydroflavonol-4-reductase
VIRTAFVTGGTGFLGRHIVEQLVAAGWHVVALHRANSNVAHLQASGAELVEGTITDAKSIERAMPPSCDAVFHVAGNTSLWSGGDEEQTRVNVDGTRIVADASVRKETKCFVHTSSVSAWGPQLAGEFDETATSNALQSSINYERSKYLGELEVEKAAKRGLRAVILSPGAIVGRYDVTGWARMIRLVHSGKLPGVPPGGGSWADAREVASAHIAAVAHGRSGERYLLGGVDATLLEFVTLIGQLTGKKVPSKALPPGLVRAMGRVSQWGSYLTRKPPRVTPEIAQSTTRPPRYFRSDKAIRELGYRAVPLAEMVRDSYEWLKEENLLDL